MRRAVLSILAATAALAGALGASVIPAGAAGVVDLSATGVSSPSSVSPPGALVFYTATFRNEGAVTVDGLFTNTTSNGSLVSASGTAGCTVPTAGTADPGITCTATLAPGEAKVVEVIIRTPTTAPAAVTNASSARVNPGVVQVVDLVTTNDDSTVVTPVQASTGVGSAGFVQEGGTLAYKKHVLTVRQADLGVVAYLNDVPAPATADCGGAPCQEGLRVDFDQDPRFFGLVAVDVNFGTGDPCRGIGNPDCHPLYFRKSPTATTAPVLACGTQGPDDPCLESTGKVGTEFHLVVVMQTDDPDLLTPVKSLTSVSGN